MSRVHAQGPKKSKAWKDWVYHVTISPWASPITKPGMVGANIATKRTCVNHDQSVPNCTTIKCISAARDLNVHGQGQIRSVPRQAWEQQKRAQPHSQAPACWANINPPLAARLSTALYLGTKLWLPMASSPGDAPQ
jgi:hypothetical protein